MEAVFQDVVQELRAAGRSILLSRHILSEAEALCDRVTIIRAGRAAESGTFDELRHLSRTSVVVDTAQPLESLPQWPGVHDSRVHDGHTEFSVDPGRLNQCLVQPARRPTLHCSSISSCQHTTSRSCTPTSSGQPLPSATWSRVSWLSFRLL